MPSENRFNSIAWTVNLEGRNLYPGAELTLHRRELENLVVHTTEQCLEVIDQTFEPETIVMNSICKRVGKLNVLLTPGRTNEITQDQEKLPIGPAADSQPENIVALPGVALPREIKKVDNRIFVSLGGIEEEMKNIHTALEKQASVLSENPQLQCDNGELIFNMVQDHELIKHTAIRLNFARRLLKYGLVHQDMFNRSQKQNIGFSEWLEYVKSFTKRKTDYNEQEVNTLQHAYTHDNIAVKSLQKTIWREWFYPLFGVDPNQDMGFYMMYYLPAVDVNNNFTLRFNDNRSIYYGKETVRQALASLYAPKATGIKRVK